MFSAARIAAIRKSKGFSQEALAEQSGVSLRTIQRVEQGETVPRGYTLQALAAALDVTLEDFRAEPNLKQAQAAPAESTAPVLRSDLDFLQILSLSPLSFLLLPLLNIIVPWWLWRARRHNTEHVAELGRRIIAFQVLWQVASFFAFMLVVVVQQLAGGLNRRLVPGIYLGVLVITYAINVFIIVRNAWRLRQGDLAIYRVKH
ncbi:helix-turn-helix transcriptional regulator [Hymenobacter sp. GOD-10R]|uniref:helix-turn-helix domain-containing protein n=1 Tax=Hymenobacter sp. GOD-10R TaxID=3093922 RepID=UPI002D78FE49|nr:helix-turn-helix transcriptional regulator [Hymenobacter sp. GOD-10R]WRQ28655.1 helix-turn-helix transcriptional regulator [Hymenobacter sp. GOD-10R]